MRELKYRAWDGEHMMDNLSSVNLEMLEKGVYTEDGVNFKPCEYLQFTGLKDKNGVEIWEGDIIKTDDGDGWDLGTEAVEYKDGFFSCIAMGGGEIGHEPQIVEVIGTKFENPELLEVE